MEGSNKVASALRGLSTWSESVTNESPGKHVLRIGQRRRRRHGEGRGRPLCCGSQCRERGDRREHGSTPCDPRQRGGSRRRRWHRGGVLGGLCVRQGRCVRTGEPAGVWRWTGRITLSAGWTGTQGQESRSGCPIVGGWYRRTFWACCP